MANSIVVSAARCRLYINNVVYSVTQSVSVTIDTSETPLFGINSPYAQAIDGGQINIKGSAGIVRTSNSGGIQAVNLRPLFSDVSAGNYVSLRLEDRQTGETIWSAPKCKISNVKETVNAKNIYGITFDFVAQVLFWPLDLS